MKEHFRTFLTNAFVRGGLSTIGRAVRGHDGCLIFYGHRVADNDEGYLEGLKPSWLDEQLAYLTRHYEVIPLSTLVGCLEERRSPPKKSVVITFDDGFRDNFEYALPLLQKHNATATVFVVTGSLSTGELPWSERLGYLFQNTAVDLFSCPETGNQKIPLVTSGQRYSAYQIVRRPLAAMCREDRDNAISQVASLLEVEAPKDRMLNWDQARDMLSAGNEIGAHTFSHPLLAEVPYKEAKWEMEKSLVDIRENLGVEYPSFCFPGGSYNDKLLELVPRLGFRSAFVPNQALRLNTPDTVTPYSLSRRGLPNAPALYLEAEVEGPFNAIRAAMGRYER